MMARASSMPTTAGQLDVGLQHGDGSADRLWLSKRAGASPEDILARRQPSWQVTYSDDGRFLGRGPIQAVLGLPGQFAGQKFNGSLQAGETRNYLVWISPEEFATTSSGNLSFTVEIKSAGGFRVGRLQFLGDLTGVTSGNGASALGLGVVARPGLYVFSVEGADAQAAGAFTLQASITGNINGDLKVDGNDAALFDAALGSKIGDPNYKPAADTSHDGEVTLDDRIFLDVNFGFASHQAPALSNGTALTHKDLPLIFDLTTLASNSAGSALTYRLIGTAHGTARISPDGASLIFTPEASFSGAANFQIQAADSLATSTAATVTVNVSSAALLGLDFKWRQPRLEVGQVWQVLVLGDFADETKVVLPASYVTFASTAPAVSGVSKSGWLWA